MVLPTLFMYSTSLLVMVNAILTNLERVSCERPSSDEIQHMLHCNQSSIKPSISPVILQLLDSTPYHTQVIMANDYLRKKWKVMFYANDVNKDNLMTIDDANLFGDRFTTHYQFGEERSNATKDEFRYFWRNFFLKGKEVMTVEDYVRTMEVEHNDDPARFRENVRALVSIISAIFDVNKDGLISASELNACLRAWGIDDFDMKYILAYPQHQPGMIAISDYQDSWVEYTCNADENNIKIEKPVLYGFRLIDEV